MTNLLLWDMDGTLSDDRQRQHFYQEKDYVSYFSYEAMMADPIYPEALALYHEMQRDGWTMGYLTARLERNRPATLDWLTKYELVSPETAILRPEEESSTRPPRFKSRIVCQIIESGKYNRVVLVDNDPLVIERVTEDCGDEHVFFADWDKDPLTASIAVIHQ